MNRIILFLFLSLRLITAADTPAGLRLAVFDSDATPPTGSALTYDPMLGTGELSLRCRGIVLLGAGEPIVLCAVDWIGIANEGHDFFRRALADAAGTTPARVALHTLHQHDAPCCDFLSERLLKENGHSAEMFDSAPQREIIARAAAEVKKSLATAQPVTHFGWGEAAVKEVASNRRIMGPDGKVRAVRFSSSKDPALRAEPEGTIDPAATVVSFWNGDHALAVLTYYATHPQSYYRTGLANPDFPGIARFLREQAVPVVHIHFNGAGGNVAAGKYNDGSREMRPILAARLEDGLARAWEATKKEPLTADKVKWTSVPVALPPSANLKSEELQTKLTDKKAAGILGEVMQLAWLQRCHDGHRIDVACLSLGSARILHLPGELFVEYQLAAKAMRPDHRVAMAAYGDYGPGYIGTARAYSEGGYETEPRSSFVAPECEAVLMSAIRRLLE